MSKPVLNINRAIHWILDWDGTITARDTLDALVNIAKEVKPKDDIDASWKRVTQAYLADYEATIAQLAPDGLPSTIIEERKLLKDLEEVEQRSIDRVSASGIFKDVTDQNIEMWSERSIRERSVRLRDIDILLHDIRTRMTHQIEDLDAVSILSVNWSQAFISDCLGSSQLSMDTDVVSYDTFNREKNLLYGYKGGKDAQEHINNAVTSHDNPREKPKRIRVYANELHGIVAGKHSSSTGVVCAKGDHKIICSNDKLNYIHHLRKINPYTLKPIPIVYVGDSWTDFESLLAADVGICIRDEPMGSSQKKLAESLQRVGVKCQHISQWSEMDEWAVVWAKNFAEIRIWVQTL
jgi:hypothetical protein